jgi:hypothetical protein
MRTISLKEFVLEEFNRMLEKEGREVRIVSGEPGPSEFAVRSRPRLVVDGGRRVKAGGGSDE